MTPDPNTLGQAIGEAQALDQVMTDLEARSESLGQVLTRTFATALVNGRSLDETLKGLALRLSNLALTAGLKPLEGLVGSAFSNLLGGKVTPFASGGVVSQPTYFAHSGGMGLMGEAGAEAILPLKRGADGALGVASDGGGGVTIHFNVTASDAESFRRSEAQIAAMLARTVRRGAGRM